MASVVPAVRMLFSSRPANGHLYPIMPLACAARSAGHDVVFSTGEPFVPMLAALGFSAFTTGLTIQEASQRVIAGGATPIGKDGRTDLSFGGRVFIDTLARPTIEDLIPVIDRVAPDVVIYGQFEFGAPVAAHVAGVPAVCHGISPQMPPVSRDTFVGDRLERLWTDVTGNPATFDPYIGRVHLDIFPAQVQQRTFASEPARVLMRPIPWNEPGFEVPQFVHERRRPLVYLTLGTMIANDAGLGVAMQGLSSLDADVLVALGSAPGEELGSLPDNVHVEGFVDQARLMPHVDLVVHHGGSGTMLAALAHGVPQVLIPKGADQFVNSDLIAAADLADVLVPAEATAEAVAEAAASALRAPRCAAIDAVKAAIAAMPHPDDVVADLVVQYG